jgi:hypothetical protein
VRKPKRLTTKEVKARIFEAATEMAVDLLGLSGKIPEELDGDRALVRAAFLSEAKRLQPKLITGKGKRYTEQELKTQIDKIKASAPEVATMFRKKLKEIQKQLPRRGGPGRTEKLSATEKIEVCEQITSLHKIGQLKKMADIYYSVSQSLKLTKGKEVSARTVKRIWDNRATLYVG